MHADVHIHRQTESLRDRNIIFILVVVRVEPERHVPLHPSRGLWSPRQPHQPRAQGESHQG